MVRFFRCGGLAPLLAPGRGTYGSVWSAAFQRCKKRAKILKWRQMRAFSNYVSEWCGRAVTACGYRGRWPWRPRAAARGYRVPFTRFTRAVAAVTAGGGAVTAAVTAAAAAVAAGKKCTVQKCHNVS